MSLVLKEGSIISSRYELIKELGEGATSKVFKAYDSYENMHVSLKILKNQNINERKIKNFKREARAISMMDHVNIIKIYDINIDRGNHFIVQEYVEGETLKENVNKNNLLDIKIVVDYIIQILHGLDHAHSKKIIHKDIKSQNILLGTDGVIKITDFGIADILEDDTTKTQSLMGTPQYVAPEVLERQDVTEQTDIYSVGILLYELLVGHAPFIGDNPTVIMMKQLNQPIPSVRKDRDEIPQSLENVLIKSTAKRVNNRYKTAKEMCKDVETALNIENSQEAVLILNNDLTDRVYTSLNMDNSELLNRIENDRLREKKLKIIIIICLITFFIFFIFLMIDLMLPI